MRRRRGGTARSSPAWLGMLATCRSYPSRGTPDGGRLSSAGYGTMRTHDRSAAYGHRRPRANRMIVLGIDPGIANTGWGVVSAGGQPRALAYGTIKTSPRTAPEIRLAEIHEAITAVLDEHAIDAMALEELYSGKNPPSAVAVGQARGVSLVLAGLRGIGCHSYTPQHVKQAV